MESEEKRTVHAPRTAEAAQRGGGPELEVAFEERTPPFVAREPARPVEPDRAPESILTDLADSAHLRSTSLQPVALHALGPSKARAGAAEQCVEGSALAPRARLSGRSRALYASFAVCGILLVAGGVSFGLARARALRSVDAPAAIAGHSTLSTGGATSLPSAPPKGASSPVESSGETAGRDTAVGSNNADPPAPALPAPTAAAPSTGTLVLGRGARPGRVWLDGVKITDASTSVACGKHEIRVKGWHKHEIRVPCGGEVRVTH